MLYDEVAVEVVATSAFRRWIRALRDERVLVRINFRLSRVAQGDFGDFRSVGGGVSEMRIHYELGYRIYIISHGSTVVVLLCRGDKDTQRRDGAMARWRDIERAMRLAADCRAGNA